MCTQQFWIIEMVFHSIFVLSFSQCFFFLLSLLFFFFFLSRSKSKDDPSMSRCWLRSVINLTSTFDCNTHTRFSHPLDTMYSGCILTPSPTVQSTLSSFDWFSTGHLCNKVSTLFCRLSHLSSSLIVRGRGGGEKKEKGVGEEHRFQLRYLVLNWHSKCVQISRPVHL